MQTRRDQVQAHAFVAGRLVAAMLRAEPDAPTTPLRRFSVGAFVGLMAGIVLIAGVGIFGFLKPGGSKAFREPGALIVEKETGARYVFVDGELKPVLNYASAKLILGDQLRVVNTSRNSLKGVPHGLPVGIDSAPDYLPDAARLGAGDGRSWQVCSALAPDITGQPRPYVTLRVGGPAIGSALRDDQGLLVSTADGTHYLAWKDRRLRIQDEATLRALGYGATRRLTVGPAWVNALPAGPDLKAPELAGLGTAGPVVGGRPTLVGQLFEVGGVAADQFFVATRAGLAPLTPTGAALVLGAASTARAYPDGRARALPLDPAALAAAPLSGQALLDPGLPPTPPVPVADPGESVPCLHLELGADTGVDARVALGRPLAPPPGRTGKGTGLADRVTVAPGAGLLLRGLPGPGVAAGTHYLLVDTGVRHPLPDAEVVQTLGYGGVPPVLAPTTLLGLIPAGRPLDPAAARTTLRAVARASGTG